MKSKKIYHSKLRQEKSKKFNEIFNQIHQNIKPFYNQPLYECHNHSTGFGGICPICKKHIDNNIWQHMTSNLDTHEQTIIEQLTICHELFFNLFYYGQEIQDFYIGINACKKYWNKWFGDLVHDRIFIKPYRDRKKEKRINPEKPIKRPTNTISSVWNKRNRIIKQIEDNIKPLQEDFYYKPLQTSNIDYNTRKETCICPICGKITTDTLWSHIISNKHYSTIKKQLQICNKLFFNQWYNGQPLPGVYISYSSITSYWRNWYPQLTSSRLKKINWKYLSKFSYYNPNLNFTKSTHICPVCGEECQKKQNQIITHIYRLWTEPKHQNLFFQILGDILSREYWTNDCFYSYTTFYHAILEIKGKDYIKTRNLKQRISKKIEWDKIKKEYYYDGDITFEKKGNRYICPVCNRDFEQKDIMNHITENRDSKHYDLHLRIVGDMLNRDFYSDECCYGYSSYCKCLIEIKGKKFLDDKRSQNYLTHYRRGYREDLGFSCNSSWEANVYRIIKYFQGSNFEWEKGIDFEIPFDISTNELKKTYFVDFYDKYGVFKKDCYIEVKGRYDDDAKYKKEMFTKLYSKNYIMIGIPNEKDSFYPEINYKDLCDQYSKIIPNWEM